MCVVGRAGAVEHPGAMARRAATDRIRGPNTEERFDLEGRKPIFLCLPCTPTRAPNDREWVRGGRWETAYCTGPTFLNARAAREFIDLSPVQ